MPHVPPLSLSSPHAAARARANSSVCDAVCVVCGVVASDLYSALRRLHTARERRAQKLLAQLREAATAGTVPEVDARRVRAQVGALRCKMWRRSPSYSDAILMLRASIHPAERPKMYRRISAALRRAQVLSLPPPALTPPWLVACPAIFCPDRRRRGKAKQPRSPPPSRFFFVGICAQLPQASEEKEVAQQRAHRGRIAARAAAHAAVTSDA